MWHRVSTLLLALGALALLSVPARTTQAPGGDDEPIYKGKPLSHWAKQLIESKDPRTREMAALALGELRRDARPAVPALIKAAETDEAGTVRSVAFVALERIGPDAREAVPFLTRTLRDRSEYYRQYALRVLKAIGPDAKEALPAVLEIAREDIVNRQQALTVVGVIGLEPALATLTNGLKAKDVEARLRAVRTLAVMGDRIKPALPALVQALKDPEPAVAREVSETIGQLGAEALPALTEALKDKDPNARKYATVALLKLTAIPPLPQLWTQPPSPEARRVRELAAQVLTGLGAEAIPLVQRALEDREAGIGEPGARILAQIGPAARAAVPELAALLKSSRAYDRLAAAEALAAIGGEAVPVLATALKENDPQVRRLAVHALAQVRPVSPEVVALLLEALAREEEALARTALFWLRRLGPEARTGALRSLTSEKAPLRAAAARTLGMFGREAESDLLTLNKALLDADATVRARAAEAFWKIDPKQLAVALPVLREVLEGKDVPGRLAAADVVRTLGLDAVPLAPALLSLLKEKDPRQRAAAARALGALGPEAAEAIPGLVSALKDSDAAVRQEVMTALQRMGPEAVPVLIKALSDKDAAPNVLTVLAEMGPQARLAYPELFKIMLEDPDPAQRKQAARALGRQAHWGGRRLRGMEAIPALRTVVQWDKDIGVRRAANKVLRPPDGATHPFPPQLPEPTPEAVEAFVKELKANGKELQANERRVRQEAVRKLAELGPRARPAIPALAALLRDTDVNGGLAHEAAQALGAIGPEAVPALVEALNDKDILTRYSAIHALKLLGAGARAAVPALEQIAKQNRDEGLGREAAEALRNIRSYDIQELLELLSSPGDYAKVSELERVLAEMGPQARKAVPELIKRLSAGSLSSGIYEARALGRLGPYARPALPALTRALNGKEPTVRAEVEQAILMISFDP